MISVNRIDHLVLTVKDIDKTVEFYTKLGMKKKVFKKNRVALVFNNQKINLHLLGSEFEPKAQNVKEGSADICFIIDNDINKLIRELDKIGIDIEEGMVNRTGATGDIRSIYVRDPDNNLIELSNYI
ncbi:virulence protein [Francisella halioticida]|uniref:VOC family protein n=1 Tax=Francisella halioticida TaxID=549298 RepID=UPI001AF26A30|nr:VOC family protein [Francisella halioticida]BCD92289.1 virulence protein [Francisella halioticida]